MYRKAMLHGVRVWIPVEWSGNDAIPPEHHVLPDGSNLDWSRCFDSPSYAHVYGDAVHRHGQQIGTIADFVDGWEVSK